jgi:2-hydroxychromene-2-carboxylate isomerase
MVKRVISERGCEINRLVEAASIAGGEPAFRKLQVWLTARIKNLPAPDQLAAEAAPFCGLTPASLKAALNDPRIDARIGQNVEAAKQLGVNASPTIFVNGRKLTDWQTPGLLEKVIQATATVPPPVYKRPH